MWASLSKQVPVQFPLAADSALRVGICLGSDHAKSCVKIQSHVEQTTDDLVYVVKGFCKQHATALCLVPMTLLLGVLCPSFCTAKLMHSGAHKSVDSA